MTLKNLEFYIQITQTDQKCFPTIFRDKTFFAAIASWAP